MAQVLVRNRYRIVRKLGKGGMGTVYEGRDELLGGVPVALKCLWPEAGAHSQRDQLLAALRSEFRILATLQHPLLCRVYDFGGLPQGTILEGAPSDGRPGYFLSRELLAGDDLSAARGRPVAEICGLFAKAAAGLDVLHRAGLRHGDFKPANAIVNQDSVRLIDFGLTASEGSSERGGTLAYAAPEILSGGIIDRRADLYALGIALYEVLIGELPFRSQGARNAKEWHRRGKRPDLAAHLPGAPRLLVELVAKLMDPDPAGRLPTAAETEAALWRAGGAAAPSEALERADFVVEALDRKLAARGEQALLARCQKRGGPAVVEIVGAPGSGRSTALTELAWRAELAGVEVVRGDTDGGGGPLAAVGPALAQLSAITGVSLSGLKLADLTAELAEIETPLAIFVDDVEYADRGSRNVLAHLASSLPPQSPIAIVCVRDEHAEPIYAGGASVEIHCPALTPREVATLIERALGRADEGFAKRLHQHTDGNLLHVVSSLKAVSIEGRHHANLSDFPLPERLAQSSARKLEALPEDTLDAVRTLAVVGKSSAAALAAVSGSGEDSIAAKLDAAAPEVVLARDGDYRFARTSFAAAVTAAIEPERLRSIHQRAATVVNDRSGTAPEVIRHQIAAEMVKEVADGVAGAVAALEAAGDHAGALELGIAGLELLERDNRPTTDLRVELGELARLAGDVERAVALLEPVTAGDAPAVIETRAALALARVLDASGDPEGADALFRRAASGSGDIAAQAIRDHAGSLLRRGKSSEALELATTGDSADPHLEVAAAYARSNLGLPGDAVATLDALAARGRELGDKSLEAHALHLAGLAAYRTGDWRSTRDYQQRALVLAEEVGDTIRVGTLWMNLAAMDQSEGAWATALERGGQANAHLRASGARTFAVMARRNHAQLLAEIGATEQARRELVGARAEAIELELEVHEIGIDALLGILAARSGEVDLGRAALIESERRFRELGDDRRAGETLLDLAEIELELAGDTPAAAALLERAGREETVTTHPGRRARLIANRALADALGGNHFEANEHLRELDRAIADLAAQKGEPLRAELHRRAAQAASLIEETDAAAAHRDRALEILGRIGGALLPEQRIAFWQDSRRRELRGLAGHAATEAKKSAPSIAASSSSNLGSDRVFRLLGIYSQLSAEENPDKLLAAAIEQAALLVGANRGFILLEKDGDLSMVASRNLPSSQLESIRLFESRPASALTTSLPFSRTVAEEVFRTGEPVIGDVRSDARFAEAASVHSLLAPSVLCVPACAAGKVVGALYLESSTTGLILGPTDARLLAAFGDQVAVLLREAELKRQLVARATDLERARAEVEALLAERTQLLADRTEELSLAVRENSRLHRQLARDGGAFGLIGSSPAMEALYELIERVASADVPALILGESGTGKELVARAIHARSSRSGKPMVAVNCGALPQTLLESELFGHVRGAFTGASRDRRGLFEAADGSTLFLDEVSETPPRMQAALLRAIQEGVIRPVGGTERSVDVRVVGASNRDLREMVSRGEFREDLLYRLEVVTVAVPPLRDRRSDIPLLCEHFLKELRGRTHREDLSISSEALRVLFDYGWPGNVRELEHALTSAAVMAAAGSLAPEDFSRLLGTSETPPAAVRAESERAEILAALERAGWNRSKAARSLGIPRRTFYRRLAKFGIQ